MTRARAKRVAALVGLVLVVAAIAYGLADRSARASVELERDALRTDCERAGGAGDGGGRALVELLERPRKELASDAVERVEVGYLEKVEAALEKVERGRWDACARVEDGQVHFVEGPNVIAALRAGDALLADARAELGSDARDVGRASRDVAATFRLGLALARVGLAVDLVVAGVVLQRALDLSEAERDAFDRAVLSRAAGDGLDLRGAYDAEGRFSRFVLLVTADEWTSGLPPSWRVPLLRRRGVLEGIARAKEITEEIGAAIAEGDASRCERAKALIAETAGAVSFAAAPCEDLARLSQTQARLAALRSP